MSRTSESSIVTKCALVMDTLTRARQPLAFSEIVSETGFVKSSCHRILAVLQGEGLVAYDPVSRTYRSGDRLQAWARAALRRTDLQQAAQDVMSDLCESSRMNVALSILDNDTILYLRTTDFFSVRFASHTGDHAPLHCTAAGKVFLAHMKPARLQATLADLRLEKFTEHTKTSLEPLLAEFPSIRENGFAVARGEETLQVTGVAAPIWNEQGQLAACLSLWSVLDKASQEEVIAQSATVIASASEIAKRLS